MTWDDDPTETPTEAPARPSIVAQIPPEDVYWKASHPDHQRRVAEVAAQFAGTPAPGAPAPTTLRETMPPALREAYEDRDNSHKAGLGDGSQAAAIEQVRRAYDAAHPEPWPDPLDDTLDDPRDRTRHLLTPPPGSGAEWSVADRQAISNTFVAMTAGDPALAQQGIHALFGLGRPPAPPKHYVPWTGDESRAALERGWGDQAERNLHLARAVIREYDAAHFGRVGTYLVESQYGNDPRLIRLAARVGRQWLMKGWRPNL